MQADYGATGSRSHMPAHPPLALLIGRRLRAARKAVGLSQVELGALVGMDDKNASPRLSRYERGEREPDAETLERWARRWASRRPTSWPPATPWRSASF